MRILDKPSVHLISRPQLNHEGLQAFLSEQGGLDWPSDMTGASDAEWLIEVAGRICYMSFGKKAGSKTNKAYIDNILGKTGTRVLPEGDTNRAHPEFRDGPAHGAVCEHPSFSFVVTGASRGFTHELVRHRVGVAYSQISTRYVDYEREPEDGTWSPGFCVPALAQLSEHARITCESAYANAVEAYKELLDAVEVDLRESPKFMELLSNQSEKDQARAIRKAARGCARTVLPIGSEAIITFSCNARAIWNMAYLRANKLAEGEIRDVFCQILKIAEVEMPHLFTDIKFRDVWDGSQEAVMPREKL